MGVYGEHVLPHLINFCGGLKVAAPLRSRVCQGLEGDVVEIGFGSGHNAPARMPVLSDDVAKRSNSGCSSSARNIVGTP